MEIGVKSGGATEYVSPNNICRAAESRRGPLHGQTAFPGPFLWNNILISAGSEVCGGTMPLARKFQIFFVWKLFIFGGFWCRLRSVHMTTTKLAVVRDRTPGMLTPSRRPWKLGTLHHSITNSPSLQMHDLIILMRLNFAFDRWAHLGRALFFTIYSQNEWVCTDD